MENNNLFKELSEKYDYVELQDDFEPNFFVMKDKKCGIVNLKGKVICECIYDNIYTLGEHDKIPNYIKYHALFGDDEDLYFDLDGNKYKRQIIYKEVWEKYE